MIVMVVLVLASITVMVGTLFWGWRHGTVRESRQERFDREFERIVADLT